MTALTLFEKLWRPHEVLPETAEAPAVLGIDLHLVHEVTSPQAFSLLRERDIPVRRPDRTLAMLDHSTPTETGAGVRRRADPARGGGAAGRDAGTQREEFGVELFGLRDRRRGIVHVVGPELGATQPGMTIVCGDSHTSTHGAFGALAFGIGTTEVGSRARDPVPVAAEAEDARHRGRGRASRRASAPRT